MARKNCIGKVQVDYFGEKLMVFPWVDWVAQDNSGTIMGYECEPIKHEQSCWDIARNRQRWHIVKYGWNCQAIESWASSLVRLPILERC